MLSRRSLLLGAGALAGCVRSASPSVTIPIDFDWDDVTSNRGDFERLTILAGDSIFRGNATGTFADLMSPGDALYSFRSVSSMANMALAASGLTDRFVYMFPIVGHGNINTDDIADAIENEVIRDYDVVAFEDAGDHSMDPDAYETFWRTARATVSRFQPIDTIMMDMFEFPAGSNLASGIDFQYERVFGTRTMNDATRAAAMAQKDYAGQTRFIAMRQIMTNYRNQVMSEYGFDPCHSDGVHLRVWSQMKMAGALVSVAGLRVTNLAPLVDYAIANLETLKYGSSTFSAAAADRYVHEAFSLVPVRSGAVMRTEGGHRLRTEDGRLLRL